MNRFFKICKYLLLIGLPGVLLLSLWGQQQYPREPVFDWVFVVSLAGFVGISTNTIAIRMLFRPREPTCLGRQGLIPRNKSRIAEQIAAETEKRLLNIDTIMAHIDRGRVIEAAIGIVTRSIEEYLAQTANRKKIAGMVLDLYSDYADRIFLWLTRTAEQWLSELISRPDTVESAWQTVKPRLKAFFESDELKHKTASWILSSLIDRIPELSVTLSDLIDRHIEDQVTWKKAALKIAKQVSGLRPEALAEVIRNILYSPETYTHITRIIEANLHSIEATLEQDSVRDKIEKLRHWIQDSLRVMTREKAIPALRVKIDDFLKDSRSWDTIDRYLVRILSTLPEKLNRFLHQEATIHAIRSFLPDIIRKFNVRAIVADNINNQDTGEFERMVMKVTGENLAAIEVLGGLLGMLVGIALKRPEFLLVIPAALALLLGLEFLATRAIKFFRPD